MSFLHPALLALLPLAAIPVILHLITLHRLRVTELSTFRFLFDSYRRQKTRLKFMEAILTALRTLFLLLLVLAVGRPVLKHWGALFRSRADGDTVMLIDCSASMNARTAGVAAMERAKRAAVAVSRRLGKEDRLTLVRLTATPEEIFSRFSPDADAVRSKIETLEPASTRANVFAALKRVLSDGDRPAALSTVYLFTDAQANGWKQARQQGLTPIIPDGLRLTVVNVGAREPLANCAVVGDEPPRQEAIAGLPVILTPRVACFGGDQPVELPVKAYINDREVARASVSLRPGEERRVELTYVPRETGRVRGWFEIPSDRFPDDDTFLFTLHIMPAVRVLLVNGHPSNDPFENEALFLRTALTSGTLAEPGGKPSAGQSPVAGPYGDWVRSLDVREISEGGLSADALREAGVVILANCGQLNASHAAWLRTYVADGGGLIIFPGDLVKPVAYNTALFPVPGPQNEGLTPLALGTPAGDPDRPETFDWLTAIDYRHPVMSVFEDSAGKYFKGVRFFRSFPLERDPLRGSMWPLAGFHSGRPALAESRLGKGSVLLAAFPVNTKWSNLPLKPEFVPLVLRMVNHVQRRPDLDVPSAASADGLAEIGVSADWSPVRGKVTDSKGGSSSLTFRRSGERFVAPIEPSARKGFYDVQVSGGSGTHSRTGTVSIALNVAPEESDFRVVGERELKEMMPKARIRMVDATAEAQQAYGSVGDENEIWRPLIWILFAVIGVEFGIATTGSTRRKTAVTRGAGARLRAWLWETG